MAAVALDGKGDMTGKQDEVLEQLQGARSRETADGVSGDLYRTALGLAKRGILNLAQEADGRLVFWIREARERATGAAIPAGFIVALNRNLEEPGGKSVNFFLFRTKHYDLTQTSFRKMLSHWLKHLGLAQKDVLQSIPVEQIGYDEPIFRNKDHIVLED